MPQTDLKSDNFCGYNTSAASIPLALDSAILSNKIVNGNLIAFQAIGGGLSWGASLVRIGSPKNI